MESSISRLVVIGATGNVGLPIVKHALERKLKVLAVSRDPSKINIKDDNLQFAAVDLEKEGGLLDILQPDDTVIFCARNHSSGGQETQDRVLRNFFKAVEENSPKRVVLTGGISFMKVDGEKRLFETEEIQRNYSFYATTAKHQVEITSEVKINWTEVDFGYVVQGLKTPESGTATIFGNEFRLIEFAKSLEDIETLSIPVINYYVMSELLAIFIVDIASKQVYLRKHVSCNNGIAVAISKTD